MEGFSITVTFHRRTFLYKAERLAVNEFVEVISVITPKRTVRRTSCLSGRGKKKERIFCYDEDTFCNKTFMASLNNAIEQHWK